MSGSAMSRDMPPELRKRISETLRQRWHETTPCSMEFLEKLYIQKEYSTRDIERIYGWNYAMVSRWLKKLNIPARKQSYWHGKEGYKNNFFTNPYGRGWGIKLKNKIKERDDYKCQMCNDADERLLIHHLDENKKNNSTQNLITLCNSCHGKLHYNKEPGVEFAMANLL